VSIVKRGDGIKKFEKDWSTSKGYLWYSWKFTENFWRKMDFLLCYILSYLYSVWYNWPQHTFVQTWTISWK